MGYYRLNKILKKQADMNVIFGERSNGKTFAVQEYALKRFLEKGEELAILRRYREDFRGKLGQDTFGGIVKEDIISKLTGGVYSFIYVYGGVGYLAYYDDELKKVIKHEKPFVRFFSLVGAEHYKSTNYEDVGTILFDEFITRNGYLSDECQLFFSIVSTIVRHRGNVKIFLLGNSVNKYGCPYFSELGLHNVINQEQGTIDEYANNAGLKIAVEYTGSTKKGKESDKFFTFDNPRTKMITGGVWECNQYPRLDFELKRKDIKFTFFVDYNDIIVSGNICVKNKDMFIFFHKKTTPLQLRKKDIIYSVDCKISHNFLNVLGDEKISRIIRELIAKNKIYFSDNDTGELVRNWYLWQQQHFILSRT